ncbi:MAG: SRPBCC family protein [Chloroflexi bacterium]|nr:SRPBCC family protein [Chloroflexota bacterium]
MASVQKSIDVNVPVRTAYDQWTQFEEFPRFMEGVKEVRQLDDPRLHWRAEIAGKEKKWDAVITEQTPDQRIAWRSTSGALNAGVVTFQPLSDSQTRIHLELTYDPEGFAENIGDAMGLVSHRVQGDLEQFKEFIESRGVETGAWRGEIHDERVTTPSTPTQTF